MNAAIPRIFSWVPSGSGFTRSIAVLERDGLAPAIALRTTDPTGRPVANVLLFPELHFATLEHAIDLALDWKFRETRRTVAFLPLGTLLLHVWATNFDQRRGVGLARERQDGTRIGRVMLFVGAELDGLRRALSYAQRGEA